MTSPAKRKGGQFERDVVTFFREHGHRYVEACLWQRQAPRRRRHRRHRRFHHRCKNHPRLDLAGWCGEASAEATNARRPRWAVIFKRKQRSTADAYVLFNLATFAELLADEEP